MGYEPGAARRQRHGHRPPGGPPSASANTSSPANADAPDVDVDLIEVDDHITGPRPADTSDMVRVGITGRRLTATAALVWHSDLPRPLQQILFDTAVDATSPPASSPAASEEDRNTPPY